MGPDLAYLRQYIHGYGLDVRRIGIRFPMVTESFLFTIVPRLAVGTTQPLIQWVPATYLSGLKLSSCQANHSLT
jgi:hypothetical protein